MTAEQKRVFLKRCDLIARDLAMLRSDLGMHGIAKTEGDNMGLALCRLQNAIKAVTAKEPQPCVACGSTTFTAPMTSKYRGD